MAPSRPPKGHRVVRGVCEVPQSGQRAQYECVSGRRGVALPRSTQAPCSIKSVSIGPQSLPLVTVPQPSIATPNCYFVHRLLVPLSSPQGAARQDIPASRLLAGCYQASRELRFLKTCNSGTRGGGGHRGLCIGHFMFGVLIEVWGGNLELVPVAAATAH